MKFGKSFFQSKINWLGIITMADAAYTFWSTYKDVDHWDWHSTSQFIIGLLIVIARTWYTSKPIK